MQFWQFFPLKFLCKHKGESMTYDISLKSAGHNYYVLVIYYLNKRVSHDIWFYCWFNGIMTILKSKMLSADAWISNKTGVKQCNKTPKRVCRRLTLCSEQFGCINQVCKRWIAPLHAQKKRNNFWIMGRSSCVEYTQHVNN